MNPSSFWAWKDGDTTDRSFALYQFFDGEGAAGGSRVSDVTDHTFGDVGVYSRCFGNVEDVMTGVMLKKL